MLTINFQIYTHTHIYIDTYVNYKLSNTHTHIYIYMHILTINFQIYVYTYISQTTCYLLSFPCFIIYNKNFYPLNRNVPRPAR